MPELKEGLVIDKNEHEPINGETVIKASQLKIEATNSTQQVKDKSSKDVQIDTVKIKICFDIDGVTIEDRSTNKALDKEIKDEKKGFLGIKSLGIKSIDNNEWFEVETKKIPKMALGAVTDSTNHSKVAPTIESNDTAVTASMNYFKVAPTIESNDTMIRVSMSSKIAGVIGGKSLPTSKPGLKVRVSQKVLGDYIIAGIVIESFQVKVKRNSSSSIKAEIEFDLKHASINDTGDINPEWEDLVEQERIAYLFFKSDQSPWELYANPEPLTPALRADFSFITFDGRLGGVAKAPGNASAVFNF